VERSIKVSKNIFFAYFVYVIAFICLYFLVVRLTTDDYFD